MCFLSFMDLSVACKGARRGTPPGPGVQTPCSPQGVRPQGPGGALIYPKRRPLRLSICNSSKYTINETFDTKNSPQKCRNFEIFSSVLSFSLSFELFSCEFFSRWSKIKPVLMQNGDFGRLGPRLDLPGKKIGGGPKAQGVSKSGEFNTLPAAKIFSQN